MLRVARTATMPRAIELTSRRDRTASYRLRFERYVAFGYLDKDKYPEGVESNDWDRRALHFGVKQGSRLLGSIRLSEPGAMPCRRVWTFATEGRTAEVSRLVVAENTDPYSPYRVSQALYRKLIATAHDCQIQTLVFAVDEVLFRALSRQFDIWSIGPSRDYLGPPTALYALDVADAFGRLFRNPNEGRDRASVPDAARAAV